MAASQPPSSPTASLWRRYKTWKRTHLWLSSAVNAVVITLALTIGEIARDDRTTAGGITATFLIFFVLPGFIRWLLHNQRP